MSNSLFQWLFFSGRENDEDRGSNSTSLYVHPTEDLPKGELLPSRGISHASPIPLPFGKCFIINNFRKYATNCGKVFMNFISHDLCHSTHSIISMKCNFDGGIISNTLKEYYEIVGESRPLSAFFPTHADFFTEMHFYSWN